ncbi:UNVERIFIED_CONTAM: DNA-binding transcriptional LysR family regulator [Paenibacillus sp. PvR008]
MSSTGQCRSIQINHIEAAMLFCFLIWSATSVFQLVKAGVGATIQPSQLIESFGSLGIRAIPIKHAPTRHLEMFYRVDKYVSPACEVQYRAQGYFDPI